MDLTNFETPGTELFLH